jgi:hypothetical protein
MKRITQSGLGMKEKFYENRKNSTGFSSNGVRFKGKCFKDLASDWFSS